MIDGLNITLPIWQADGVSFHNLVLRKPVVDSVVMSLSDKITGDVYYKDSDLVFTMREYVTYNDVNYYLVNPPTVVREGLVKDNSDLKGMTKYSLEFYHPMYILSNMPFTDVAVSYDELRYKSQDKTFSWIGKPADFVAKLNKNLDGTEWIVVLSDRFPQDKVDELSEVLSFDNATIGEALKKGYETWNVPYVVDKLYQGEYRHTDANHHNTDYYDEGKRFVILFGLPSNEIYGHEGDTTPFVFKFGQGLGLKNNSRNPRNNKIITRIAGYGSENNIPYGYPQIRWYGDSNATCTIGDSVGVVENVTINGKHYDRAMSYPIYQGIVGGEYVKLIKHPFTRNHLMPSIYSKTVFDKVSQFTVDENNNVIANENFTPDIEIIDYYDAVENQDGYDYQNLINPSAPSYEIHEFSDIKPELGEEQILGATPINAQLNEVEQWDDTMDDNGNYLQSYFKLRLPRLGFDIYACAAITQEMQINMRSGACIGCTFTVQVDWEDYKMNFYDSDMNFAPHGSQRNYERYPDSSQGEISVIVQKDINTFGTLMPNIYQKPESGDFFVVLGISLPLDYIYRAQSRLDDAMKSYMLENNVYYFDYPLKFDEHFLHNYVYALNQIRPNSIIRFEYNGQQLELFVKQLTIKYGDNVLPQYDITLTDNVDVVLNAIGQVADDVQHIGSLIAILRQSYSKSVWVEIAKKLSKVDDDTANGLITFLRGLRTGQFVHGWLGSGANIDARGNSEFESIYVRGALRAAELVFNLIRAEGGERIESIGNGEILTVDEANMVATLKLDGDTWATIDEGDICRGLYNTIDKDFTVDETSADNNGFRNEKGFFASYFKVEEILTNTKGECSFRYSLQTDEQGNIITEHPCPLMKFAVYGNTDDNKKERQSSIYTTAVGIAPRQLYLAHVNDWQIKPQNIKIAKGYIDGLQVYEKQPDGSTQLKVLEGDAGFFVEDNIYFGGILNQFTAADWEYMQDQLGQGIHAQLTRGSDNIVVDALGNVVGGLYTETTDNGNVSRKYKLHTGVLVYDSGKGKYLTLGTAGSLADDEFSMTVTANGCTVLQDGSDIYVTSIDNTANGIELSDEQLEAMRDTDGFSVDFVIVTASGWKTIVSYPVKITHLDQSYITFDLTNEMDSMSYRTQTRRYAGLPVSTTIKGYVNGVEVDELAGVNVASDMFNSTMSTTSQITSAAKSLGNSGLVARLNGNVLTIDHQSSLEEVDFADAKHWFDISCIVKYAGVRYTSPVKRFTLVETTDATLYKLLLSANAVSKDEGTYTPSTIDVKVQITDNAGVQVVDAANMTGNVKVRYINGVYSTSAQLLSAMPQFKDVPVCITVVLIDTSDNTILDLESVPMTAVGRNGAGQPWVQSNYENFYIDCDSDGNVLRDQSVIITGRLYWGDNPCTLDTGGCYIATPNEGDDTPDSVTSSVASKQYTFRQGDAFDTLYVGITLYGTYDGTAHTANKVIPIVANRNGKKGETGNAGAALILVGEWVDAMGYTWDANIRHAVKHKGMYWLVNVPCVDDYTLGEPTSENGNWLGVTSLRITATDLLLAENATINLLSSNIINLFNDSGVKTASINGDGQGEYCIHWPSGGKRMTFSYDGFIHYYYENGSEAWRIGMGGEIERFELAQFVNFPLAKITTTGVITSESRFVMSRDVWKFHSGSSGLSQYEGLISENGSSINPPSNPATATRIDDGRYTPDTQPYQILSEGGSAYAITVYTIQNGFITRTQELTEL